MRKFTILLMPCLLMACGGGSVRTAQSEAEIKVRQYTYSVRATYPHGTSSYTQGLQYADGYLWEGTGQYGQSVVQRTDLSTGRTEVLFRLPKSEFGEGITVLGGKLYQLTWESNTAHVYDLTTMSKERDFRYPGEGWGLTSDGEKLYLSDGSSTIHTLDPATFKRERRITVTYKGEPQVYLNELEWIEGKIWANVYTTDRIVIIDPSTGVVEGVVDLRGLLPAADRTPNTDVLNGIAYDAAAKRIFVTGKNWSKVFEIEIFEK